MMRCQVQSPHPIALELPNHCRNYWSTTPSQGPTIRFYLVGRRATEVKSTPIGRFVELADARHFLEGSLLASKTRADCEPAPIHRLCNVASRETR